MADLLPSLVYILCFVTSGLCAWLLARSYRRTSARLLLWSALCFGLLALNNLLLVVDLVLLPAYDLRLIRYALSASAVTVLLVGLIWDMGE
jgi:hypothetical protein